MKKYYISYLVTFILNGFIFSQTTLHVPSQYPTIQEALNAAQAGDTVLVQPGTYYENIFWPNINGIKLISAGKQITAMALGADACYTARGFMFALGCIQALKCNNNTCPVGITTHDKSLQKGLVIAKKSQRVKTR